MKNEEETMQKRSLQFAAVFALFVLFALTPNLLAQPGTLVGAWEITVNVNVPPGAPPFILTEVGTFNLGGTFADTTSIAHSSQNPYVPPPLAVDFSDGYGVWRQTPGTNQFAITLKRLTFAGPDTPTSIYGTFLQGQQVGEAIIEVAGTLQSDGTLAGAFTFQLTSLADNGAVVFADGGKLTATQIKIQPLAAP
jgi:hypothetical protein